MVSIIALRSMAIDRAWRTRLSPSAPLKLETMNASTFQPEPSVTCTFELLRSWSSVEIANA